MTRVFIFMAWMLANLIVGFVMSQFRRGSMTSLLVFVSYCLVIY